jgi:hypothetical protein
MATGRRGKKKARSNGKSTAPLKMRDVGCDSVSYRFKVALEKFDLVALRKAVHADDSVKRNFHVVNNTRVMFKRQTTTCILSGGFGKKNKRSLSRLGMSQIP